MKKKIAVFVMLAVLASCVFAGEYVYLEKSKKLGNVEVFAKLCCPIKMKDALAGEGNYLLDDLINYMFDEDVDHPEDGTVDLTMIMQNQSTMHTVMFAYSMSSDEYAIFVQRMNFNSGVAKQIFVQEYSNFNSAYKAYEDKCDEYLRKL